MPHRLSLQVSVWLLTQVTRRPRGLRLLLHLLLHHRPNPQAHICQYLNRWASRARTCAGEVTVNLSPDTQRPLGELLSRTLPWQGTRLPRAKTRSTADLARRPSSRPLPRDPMPPPRRRHGCSGAGKTRRHRSLPRRRPSPRTCPHSPPSSHTPRTLPRTPPSSAPNSCRSASSSHDRCRLRSYSSSSARRTCPSRRSGCTIDRCPLPPTWAARPSGRSSRSSRGRIGQKPSRIRVRSSE